MGKARLAFAFLLVVAIGAVIARYFLFSHGILYGETAAKMASLMVAGLIVLAGFVPLWLLRRAASSPAAGGQASSSPTGISAAAAEPAPAARESIVATVAAILGLAITAYSLSELVAPNTPVEAAAPACAGAPVYGARFFAETTPIGANSRIGPGRAYQQVNRYSGNCTLGFDGYCIGSPEPDFRLGTPDQRWLLVHHRGELIASAVVQSQTAESALGATPSRVCAKLGGLPLPTAIQQFTYNHADGRLTASAPGAASVGYGLASPPPHLIYQAVALGTDASFSAALPPGSVATRLKISDGNVWLGAAICLADNVPVVRSLRVLRLELRHSQVIGQVPEPNVPEAVRPHLAEIACNSAG